MVDDAIIEMCLSCISYAHFLMTNQNLIKMEQKTIFGAGRSHESMQKILAMPAELQRFKFYEKTLYTERFGTRKETDTHVYWSICNYIPRYENNKLFYTLKDKEGFTYDKAKKTIRSWWSRSISKVDPLMLADIMEYFKVDWFKAMPISLRSLLTLPLLKRIVKGKLTNPIDFVKSYLKTSPYKKLDISPKVFYDTLMHNSNIINIKSFRTILEYSTNANHALTELLGKVKSGFAGSVPLINDIYAQAAMLNKRVNPLWSNKRMQEVHTEWTREVMGMQLKCLDKIVYKYPEGFDKIKLDSVELIKDNFELFEEGTLMNHCIYSNYHNIVANYNYFAVRYKKGDVRATVGINLGHENQWDYDYINNPSDNEKKFVVQQMYGIGNSKIDDVYVNEVKTWLNSIQVQNYFSIASKRQGAMKIEAIDEFLELANIGIH